MNIGRRIFFIVLFIVSIYSVFAQLPNRTVNLPGVGVSNFSTITAALNGVTTPATIWVAAGKYTENELIIPLGVTVIGGFPTNASSLANRIFPGMATTAQKTILSGNYTHRVATVRGVLDGCVITQGYAYDNTGTTPVKGAGGGILIDGGIVQNCILHDNVASNQAPSPNTIPGSYVASIGDVYCTDGTILKPTYKLNQNTGKIEATLTGGIPGGKTPQGIVFYIDKSPTAGKIYVMGKVTTNQLQPWFNTSPMYNFPTPDITSGSAALADYEGKTNSATINSGFSAWHSANPSTWYEGWDNDNPVPYCLNYNIPAGTLGDWYLPAAGEMYKLWEVFPQMDACARDILGWIGSGTTMFPKSAYWTSTENSADYVWILNTYSYPWGGWGLSTVNKTQGAYTVPVTVKTLTVQ